jgi:hypothetical protein
MIDRHRGDIAAYSHPENKVALAFVEGLNKTIQVCSSVVPMPCAMRSACDSRCSRACCRSSEAIKIYPHELKKIHQMLRHPPNTFSVICDHEKYPWYCKQPEN